MRFPQIKHVTDAGIKSSIWESAWVQRIAIISIFGLAVGLRLGCSNRSLWYDEAVTYWEATPSSPVQTAESFSPLPNYIIRPLVGKWEKPWMLRLPFVFLGVISILLFSLAAAKMYDRGIALKVGLLLAISPFHILYSTEMRMYAIALFGCALNFLFFLKVLDRGGKKNWFLYSLGGIIAVYAHPFTALQLIAQGIFLLVNKDKRRLFYTWFWNQLVIFLLFIPLLIYGLKNHGAAEWVTSRPLMALAGTFYSFLMGMNFVFSPFWLFYVTLSALLFGFLLIKGVQADRHNRFLITGLFFFPVASTVLISTFFAGFYSDQSTRYLTFAQPFLLFLFVAGLATIGNKKIRNGLFVGAIMALFIAVLPTYLLWDRVGFGNFEKAAQILRQQAQSQDVILSKALSGEPIAYYLRDGLIKQMIIKKFGETLTPYPQSARLWIVRLQNRSMLDAILSPVDPKDLAPMATPAGYRMIKHHILPGRKPLTLTLFEVKSNDPLSLTKPGRDVK